MFRWVKLGRIFAPQEVRGRPWCQEFAQAPATLILDDVVRVYFSCRPFADSNGQYVSYSGYVDLNRSNLLEVREVSRKPVLPLGSTGTFDEFGIYPVSVVRCDDKVRLYYGGWTRCESVPFNVAIGLAESIDNGCTFQKTGRGPVLSYSPYEPFIISGPKVRYFDGMWILFYIAGTKWKSVDSRMEPVYKIRMATSKDGLIWNKEGRDLIRTKIEDDEAQASPDVFFSNGAYHMFFCYRYSERYRNKARGYRIGYAKSVDLKRWERDDAKAGIDVSVSGWDSEMVSYPHVFELDEKIYMLYLGNDVGREGFGLAALEGSLD